MFENWRKTTVFLGIDDQKGDKMGRNSGGSVQRRGECHNPATVTKRETKTSVLTAGDYRQLG
ncbi:hypothetical protein [Ruegeria sp. PrR005]|uniref:Uncharacterized protein n=1 Tax=Ruegeria sp. PrR005 TaxID=2706882 RepID=A0A6B2NL48_9RHOB|nr:hypothetical protein [Ruegeria sp. PrR005]NDW43920.1 hypothetical protein [Ruegeria sp. PrR005]